MNNKNNKNNNKSNKSNNKIYIDRLFPNVYEYNLYNKLKINHESIMYISGPNDAEQITNIISYHSLKYFPSYDHIHITDATAGVGGNAISFAQRFKHVNAIEIDTERFNYLLNNINVYQTSNTTLYNGNCLTIIPDLPANDIIFIDPPWGGRGYKNQEKIRLTLGTQKIEDICCDFLDSSKMISVPKIIAIKLPKNYDIEFIYQKLKTNRKIYFYQLNKMIVIVIENGYYTLPEPV